MSDEPVFEETKRELEFDPEMSGLETSVQGEAAVTYASDMETATETITFNAQERCDRCGAQALARASHEGLSDLLFCKHHVNEQRDGLTSKGWTIHA